MASTLKLSPRQYKRLVRVAFFVWDLYTLSAGAFSRKWPKAYELANRNNYEYIIMEAIRQIVTDQLDGTYAVAFK
jgi:hypothetical protein